ncbi:MAG: selenium cofactor biosynthesis protein YqeC [Acidobacteriota bacterium]|nr:selenium cofactor biosynthesis protein YqeC [Blastocatellia bacterium]MDW8239983.1 selenium cofactor biosynthesis protein YqeC [Acidobacteriota bacterium]
MDLAARLKLRSNDVVSFVGGGGKTTCIFRLGRELFQQRRKAIITTTTRIGAWQTDGHPVLMLSCWPTASAWLSQLHAQLAFHSVVIVVAKREDHKLIGIAPEAISSFCSFVDAVLVEADGARSRSLKAPAAYEPVWPPATTLAIAVVGVDAVGAPFNSTVVHRLEQVAAIAGLSEGELITPHAVASCILHEDGLFARVPSMARRCVLINKVNSEAQRAVAMQIAQIVAGRDSALDVVIADVRLNYVKVWL